MVFLCLLLVLPFSGFFSEFSGLNVDPAMAGERTELSPLLLHGQRWLRRRLPCRVRPEREDLEDTDDCMETTDVVSPMVLSVMKPPLSPSVWTVIVDWKSKKRC